MSALPEPDEDGDLSLLNKYVALTDDAEYALLYGWLVAAAWPEGPYPALELVGEKGSGKSTAAEILRSIVDPSQVPIRACPRDVRDIAVAANNSHVLAFDNLSGVPPWISDVFCQISTGGGFSTRKLYTDSEEELFWFVRPLIVNGIDDVATRGDLADRSITIRPDSIPEEARRPKGELWAAFEKDLPAILGGLLDALATALARIGSVKLDRLPRMADFAKLVVAAEPALPIRQGTFLRVYEANRSAASEDAVRNDTVAAAIVEILEDRGEWDGTPSALLEDMKNYLPNPAKPPVDYPGSYQALTSHLRRIMPSLRAVGIERREDPRKKSAGFTLSLKTTGGKTAPSMPPGLAAEKKSRMLLDGTNTDQHPAAPQIPPRVLETKGVEGVDGVGLPLVVSEEWNGQRGDAMGLSAPLDETDAEVPF